MFRRAEVKKKAREKIKRNLPLVTASVFFYLATMSLFQVAINVTTEEVAWTFLGIVVETAPFAKGAWLVEKVAMYSLIFTILFGYPLEYGFRNLCRSEEKGSAQFKELFQGFHKGYSRILAACFFRDLLVMLGLVLLIVPGIYLSCCFRFVPYLLKDEPGLSVFEVLKKSARLSEGWRMEILKLDISFLLWKLAPYFGFGFLMIYSEPYKRLCEAALYREVQNSAF